MACYHPWRLDGKPQVLPCGQCRGCRAAKSREWSMRCMHEASLHKENSFLTLTVDDEHLGNGSLDRTVFASFMKRLRERLPSQMNSAVVNSKGEEVPFKLRYFQVGEYGSRTNRPHYHALLFGYNPPDRVQVSMRAEYPVFTSELLRDLWRAGSHELGSVTPQSAGYVAKYIRKRLTGRWAKVVYGEREPPFALMSRNPGIGAGWIDKFEGEVYRDDSVIVVGKENKPPRYYDRRIEKRCPGKLEEVKWNREKSRNWEEERGARLHAREVCQIAKESLESEGNL